MKKIRYGIAAILFFLGFTFTGEYFMQYLDNFEETYYGATFSFADMEEEKSSDEIIRDFLKASAESHVDFFTVDDKINSDYKKTITIYGTGRALDHLKEHGIEEKRYKSLFSGYIDVVFRDIQECGLIKRQEFFYFTGEDIDSMNQFKDDLAGQYGGEYPIMYDSIKSYAVRLSTFWSIIFFIVILLTVYDITLQRKEYTLRVILGYNLKSLFLKNLVQDTAAFSGMYFGIMLLMGRWTNVGFLFFILVTLFTVFLILNACMNLLIFRVNVKKNFSNAKENQGFLKINYAIKIITLLAVSLALSVNIGLMREGINYHRQMDFFRTHAGYDCYQLNYKDDLVAQEMDGIVAQEFYQKFYGNSLVYAELTGMLSVDYPTVLINRNSWKEMISDNKRWKEILGDCKEEKMYIAVPEHLRKKTALLSDCQDICEFVLGYEEKSEIVYYGGKTRLIGFKQYLHPFKSSILKTPIVIYDNTEPVINEALANRQLNYRYDFLYDIPDSDAEQFMQEHQLENEIVIKTNAGKLYGHNLKIVKRFTKMSFVLSLFLLLLEFIMVFVLVKMEYMYRALEITLMKIFGYSQIRRISKLILITVLCGVSAVILLILYWYKTSAEVAESIACVLMFTLFELFMILRQAGRLERSKIVLILKGDQL